MFAATSAQAGTYLDGLLAYDRGDFVEAASHWRDAAGNGNSTAQQLLGDAYRDGRGVEKSSIEAAKWYRLAADGGNSNAQFQLGSAYLVGNGVAQDKGEAVKLLTASAERNNSAAKLLLGEIAEESGDMAIARQWYQSAAERCPAGGVQ